MTDRWSFKFEYDFYDFAHRNLTFVDGTAGSFVEDVKQQIHAGTFSINYRFGPGQSWAHY